MTQVSSVRLGERRIRATARRRLARTLPTGETVIDREWREPGGRTG
jgi:hypothetical protein